MFIKNFYFIFFNLIFISYKITIIQNKICNHNFFYFINCFSKSDNKIINNKTLIISMTSYPPRIKFVKNTFISIIKQNISSIFYHCVLVLSISEFPNKELDLPQDLLNLIYVEGIEILWYKKNIRSHKKLIPTLKKYPNNSILIIDDDNLREEGFIQTFLDDHKKYPHDIIFGYSRYVLNKNYKFIKKNKIKENEYILARPSNGLGGTLYPPNTFTDKRFFYENIYMKLSPSSDESWQWCFAIIENKKFRKLSKNFKINLIPKSQKKTLYKENMKLYNNITKFLYEYFPDFKKELDKRIKICYK